MAEKRNFRQSRARGICFHRRRSCGTGWSRPRAKCLAHLGSENIRPPIFEPTELFARAVGGETDIVSKEMYSFEDHGWIELAQYRAALTVRSISPGLTSEFSQYERSVLSYIDILAERMSAGDVPRTPENERALTHARRCLGDMNRGWDELYWNAVGTGRERLWRVPKGSEASPSVF